MKKKDFTFVYPRRSLNIGMKLNNVMRCFYTGDKVAVLDQLILSTIRFPNDLKSLINLCNDIYPNDLKTVRKMMSMCVEDLVNVEKITSMIRRKIRRKFNQYFSTIHLEKNYTPIKIREICMNEYEYKNKNGKLSKVIKTFLNNYENNRFKKRKQIKYDRKMGKKEEMKKRRKRLVLGNNDLCIYNEYNEKIFELKMELSYETVFTRNFIGHGTKSVTISLHESSEQSTLVMMGFNIIDDELKYLTRTNIDRLAGRDKYTLSIQNYSLTMSGRKSNKYQFEKLKKEKKIEKTDGRKLILIATKRNTNDVVGALLYREHCLLMELLLMAVKSKNQVDGVGSILIDTLKFLVSRYTTIIYVKSDMKCIPFYEKNGFVKNIYLVDEIINCKFWFTTESISMECRRYDCHDDNFDFLLYNELKKQRNKL